MLLVAASYRWAEYGNVVIAQNWQVVRNASPGEVAHQLFNGICIGMLGLTGFECLVLLFLFMAYSPASTIGTPSYVSSIKPGRFSIVLRNLHYTAILFNATCMLAVVAVLPMEESLAAANVLARLAQEVIIAPCHRTLRINSVLTYWVDLRTLAPYMDSSGRHPGVMRRRSQWYANLRCLPARILTLVRDSQLLRTASQSRRRSGSPIVLQEAVAQWCPSILDPGICMLLCCRICCLRSQSQYRVEDVSGRSIVQEHLVNISSQVLSGMVVCDDAIPPGDTITQVQSRTDTAHESLIACGGIRMPSTYSGYHGWKHSH